LGIHAAISRRLTWAKTDVFFYRGVYSAGANYFLIFPYDDTSALGHTDHRIISELLAKVYPADQAQKLEKQFASTISLVQEVVSKTRPDMSSNLENKFKRWW
jgi:hypothetical protein